MLDKTLREMEKFAYSYTHHLIPAKNKKLPLACCRNMEFLGVSFGQGYSEPYNP